MPGHASHIEIRELPGLIIEQSQTPSVLVCTGLVTQ